MIPRKYARAKDRYLQRHYGITWHEYMQLWKSQGGKCAICSRELRPPGPPNDKHKYLGRVEIDHKHYPRSSDIPIRSTVRGLLCGGRYSGCNHRLGRVDDAKWLEAALAYVTKPPAQTIIGKTNVKKERSW